MHHRHACVLRHSTWRQVCRACRSSSEGWRGTACCAAQVGMRDARRIARPIFPCYARSAMRSSCLLCVPLIVACGDSLSESGSGGEGGVGGGTAGMSGAGGTNSDPCAGILAAECGDFQCETGADCSHFGAAAGIDIECQQGMCLFPSCVTVLDRWMETPPSEVFDRCAVPSRSSETNLRSLMRQIWRVRQTPSSVPPSPILSGYTKEA